MKTITWPACQHCGQSATGSYLGVLRCARCYSRVRVVDAVVLEPNRAVRERQYIAAATREDQ